MKQIKLESLLEQLINIAIGYTVALISQLVIFPQVGIYIELETNLIISFWFTLVSLIRGYIIRRWFNAGIHKAVIVAAKKLARG